MNPGDRLFTVESDDSLDSTEPPLQLVEWSVVHVTSIHVTVRVDVRGGRPVKYKTQERWPARILVYTTATAALEAYADQQEDEAARLRAKALRCTLRAEWARTRIEKEAP